MHPSRFHTTTKKSAHEARFGFEARYTNNTTPSKGTGLVGPPRTAPKPVTHNPFSSPSFEFRFTRPSADLSSEAKKMMDELREQASRIKQELATHREEQQREDGMIESAIGGRKMAKPKGKAGRFSDVHLEQFKKMDSIANHPSSYRADPARFPPATNSLKRTKSKAELDKPDDSHEQPGQPGCITTKVPTGEPLTPAKRSKMLQDISTSRPSSRDSSATESKPPTPTFARPKEDISASNNLAFSTPEPTLPRPASVTNVTATCSKIPSLNRTPSSKSIGGNSSTKQAAPQSEATNKYRRSFSNKLKGVKSIMRRPQLRFSNDPLKLAAGTHVSIPKSIAEATAATPQRPSNLPLPAAPDQPPGTPSHRDEKHVNFSPDPAHVIGSSNPGTPNTPSPTKKAAGLVAYPELPSSNRTNCFSDAFGSAHNVAVESMAKVRASAPGPGDFTFRADKAISFAPPPSANAAASSVVTTTPTIRKVRASDASGLVPASATKLGDLPSVPHGLSNKKRKREEPDSENQVQRAGPSAEDKENEAVDSAEKDGSPVKRRKITAVNPRPAGNSSVSPKGGARSSSARFLKRGPAQQKQRQKGKGVLSLRRLSELARPKDRK